MSKIFKKTMIMMMCLFLIFTFTACSSENQNGSDTKPPADQQNPGESGGEPDEGDTPGMGEGNNDGQPDEAPDEVLHDWGEVKGKIVTENYPEQVAEYIEANKDQETQQAFNIGYRTFIVMTMGEQSSAGYAIELQDVQLQDGILTISAVYEKPGKDDVVATVMTYPTLVLELDDIYLGHYEIEYDIEK